MDDVPLATVHCGKTALNREGRKSSKLEEMNQNFIVDKARSVQGKSDKN